MIEMNFSEVAYILGQTIESNYTNKSFTGISIDTRTLQAGNLFIAIASTKGDGHHFIDEAYKKGAAGALVSKKMESPLPQIHVENTVMALGKLTAVWRDQFKIPLIAVTGSNGKTTLKNMIAAILIENCNGDDAQVLFNQGTFNNHLGLPLTLARLNAQHRFAVAELGMNHFGEIEYLTKLAKPHVAIITNAAASHLEGVGDLEGVARAKSEIFLGMSANGIAILNRDDAFFTFWLEQIAHNPYLTFGFHPDADIRASLHENKPILHTPQGDIDIVMQLLGKHNIQNMMAATAAALAIGIDLNAIKRGLENISPAPGRMQLHPLPNGVNIIDDTYNANPLSLAAAIDSLAAFSGKKILVLGDMKELGSDAISLHQNAGEKIRFAGIDYLFTYGDLSHHTALAFGEGAFHFNEQGKLVNALKPFLYHQTTILIKGSRSMHMEKVVAELLKMFS